MIPEDGVQSVKFTQGDRQDQDAADECNLRRLDRIAPNHDPTGGPVEGLSNERQGKEQTHRSEIGWQCQIPNPAVVNEAGDEEDRGADDDPFNLFPPEFLVLDCGIAVGSAIDGKDSEDHQSDHGDGHDPVDA